jgi:hypothetical protein
MKFSRTSWETDHLFDTFGDTIEGDTSYLLYSGPISGKTVSQNNGSASVTGVNTTFLTDLNVGDAINIGNEVFEIATIPSDISLTTTVARVGSSVTNVDLYTDYKLFGIKTGFGTEILNLIGNDIKVYNDLIVDGGITQGGNNLALENHLHESDYIRLDGTNLNRLLFDDSNILSGIDSGYSLTTGTENILNGYQTGYSLTTGFHNILNGYQSGYSLTTGSYNILNGTSSGYNLSTGIYNILNGTSSGRYLTTGSDNIGLGRESLRGNAINKLTGSYNIGIGYQSGYNLTTGHYNILNGFQSGYSLTTGRDNTFNGTQSGYSLTTGSYNIGLGYLSGYYLTTGSNNIGLGRESLRGDVTNKLTGSYNIGIGYRAGYSLTTGNYNTLNGYQAGYYLTTGSDNIGLGRDSLRGDAINKLTGSYNIGIGYQTGYNLTTGSYNTLSGFRSGYNLTTGYENILNGFQSGRNLTTGSYNIGIGRESLRGNATNKLTGSNNIGFGYQTGYSLSTGSDNILIGSSAGANDNFSNNILIGTNVYGKSGEGISFGSIGNVLFFDGGSWGTTTNPGTMNVGILTRNPTNTLHVVGDTKITENLLIGEQTSTTTNLSIKNNSTPILGTGTVSITSSSTTVTGVGTLFLSEALANSVILINGTYYTVYYVQSDTQLVLLEAATSTVSGISYYIEPIPLEITGYKDVVQYQFKHNGLHFINKFTDIYFRDPGFDNFGWHRITNNDGSGNFSIRIGSYNDRALGAERYHTATSGAVLIQENGDSGNGKINLFTKKQNTGSAGDSFTTWDTTLILDSGTADITTSRRITALDGLFYAYNGASITLTTTGTVIPFNTQVRYDTETFYHTATISPEQIQIKVAGWYEVTFDFSADTSDTVNRQDVKWIAQYYNGTTWVTISGTDAYTYHRISGSGKQSASISFLYNFSANNYVRLVGQATIASTISTVIGGCRCIIKRV